MKKVLVIFLVTLCILSLASFSFVSANQSTTLKNTVTSSSIISLNGPSPDPGPFSGPSPDPGPFSGPSPDPGPFSTL